MKLSELIGSVFAFCLIAAASVVVVGCCVLLIPFQILKDQNRARMRKLCPSCAGLDRENYYELIYHRPDGIHACPRCKQSYSVERLA